MIFFYFLLKSLRMTWVASVNQAPDSNTDHRRVNSRPDNESHSTAAGSESGNWRPAHEWSDFFVLKVRPGVPYLLNLGATSLVLCHMKGSQLATLSWNNTFSQWAFNQYVIHYTDLFEETFQLIRFQIQWLNKVGYNLISDAVQWVFQVFRLLVILGRVPGARGLLSWPCPVTQSGSPVNKIWLVSCQKFTRKTTTSVLHFLNAPDSPMAPPICCHAISQTECLIGNISSNPSHPLFFGSAELFALTPLGNPAGALWETTAW